MNSSGIGRTRSTRRALLVVAAFFIAWPVAAAEWTLVLVPDETRITFTIDATLHTVEGSFSLESGEIRFVDETHAVSGEVIVDARSGTTWIGRRDRKMHARVLESDEYPVFAFRPERIQGTFDPGGPSEFLLMGAITIRGVEHPLTMPVVAEVEGDQFTARAAFPIPFVEWGMEDPSTWYLRVAKEVAVSVELTGRLTTNK